MLAKDFKCDNKTWDDLFKVSKDFKGEIKRPDEPSSWDTKELRELAKNKNCDDFLICNTKKVWHNFQVWNKNLMTYSKDDINSVLGQVCAKSNIYAM